MPEPVAVQQQLEPGHGAGHGAGAVAVAGSRVPGLQQDQQLEQEQEQEQEQELEPDENENENESQGCNLELNLKEGLTLDLRRADPPRLPDALTLPSPLLCESECECESESECVQPAFVLPLPPRQQQQQQPQLQLQLQRSSHSSSASSPPLKPPLFVPLPPLPAPLALGRAPSSSTSSTQSPTRTDLLTKLLAQTQAVSTQQQHSSGEVTADGARRDPPRSEEDNGETSGVEFSECDDENDIVKECGGSGNKAPQGISCMSTQTDPSCTLFGTGSAPPNWTDSHERFRILLIFANPTNTHPLRLQTEEKSIREALKRGECGENISVDVLLACTVDDLARQLLSHSYEVIHFSGHADRSASLFRHTMKALHSSYDVDLASLKRPHVSKQVETAVEALAERFEASLLSCPDTPSVSSSIKNTSSQRHHYCSVTPSLPVQGGAESQPRHFAVTSTQHRDRVEKDIHNIHHPVPCPRQHLRSSSSFASHLLVKEVEVEEVVQDSIPRSAPHGSERIESLVEGENTINDHQHLKHELHIPKLVVNCRSSPSEEIEIEYRKTFTYQDIMDIGVGSLAFESESHDASSGISFVSPPSLASLLAEHGGPSLQCVLLNVCGGHIQGDLLSSVVPFTVCFTGKVADKESLAFSKGFYDSIAMGHSVQQAFRVGSGRMDLHKLAPGVPDRLSSIPPLLTLLKNKRLLEESHLAAHASKQLLLQQRHQMLVSDSASTPETEKLRIDNAKYLQENKELRSLIAYGMELMKNKDDELKAMRQALDYVSQAAGLGNGGGKKIGNGNNSVNGSGKRSSSNGGLCSSKAENRSTQPGGKKKFTNVKSSGYGRRPTKSNSVSNRDSSRKPNFIKRNKAMLLKSKNEEGDLINNVGGSQTKTSTTVKKEKESEASREKYDVVSKAASSLKAKSHLSKSSLPMESTARSVRKQPVVKQNEKSSNRTQSLSHTPQEMSTQLQVAPPCPLALYPPAPPAPEAVKCSIMTNDSGRMRSRSKSEQAKYSPSRAKQSRIPVSPGSGQVHPSTIQKAFPTTITLAKPKAWVKYYIGDSSSKLLDEPTSYSVLGEGDGDTQLPRNSHSPPPHVHAKKPSHSQSHSLSKSQAGENSKVSSRRSSSGVSQRGASSSEGWRKFLQDRRAERKPSAAFASGVPRFEHKNVVGKTSSSAQDEPSP